MRLKRSIIFCFAFLLLTGWGHLGPKVKIGLSLDHTQGREPFLKKFQEALNDDHADLLLKDASDDPAAQENQVKDLIQQGIQTLVVISCDPSKASPLVTAAHTAGIKVIALEQLIPGSDLDYFIDFNYVKAGELQAKTLIKTVPKGRYILLDEGSNSTDIRKGQLNVLQSLIDHGNIQIVTPLWSVQTETDTKRQKLLIDSMISPKLNHFDAIALPNYKEVEKIILFFIKGQFKVDFVIAGMGEDLATCRRIASGTQLMTVYYPPKKLAEETAYLAAKLARKATEFDCQFVEIPNGEKSVKAVLLAPVAVDAKNLDSTIIADQVQKKEDVYSE